MKHRLIVYIGSLFMLSSLTTYGQESYSLPDYQLGFTLNYNSPYGYVRYYLDEGSLGFSVDFNVRIKENSPMMAGIAYSVFTYDRAFLDASQIATMNFHVNIRPKIRDFILYGKYEILSGYYVIPFVEAGLGIRYYATHIEDIDPLSGEIISTFTENRDVGFLGRVGLGVGIPLYSQLLIELGAHYSRCSPISFDYLAEEATGVQSYPLDFYSITKSAQSFIVYELSIIVEMYN